MLKPNKKVRTPPPLFVFGEKISRSRKTMKITREYLDKLDRAREAVKALSVCEWTKKPIEMSKAWNKCETCDPEMRARCDKEIIKRINSLM